MVARPVVDISVDETVTALRLEHLQDDLNRLLLRFFRQTPPQSTSTGLTPAVCAATSRREPRRLGASLL